MDRPESLDIRDRADRHRYEAWLDGRLVGSSDYHVSGDSIAFTHAEVDPDFGGQGIGSALAQTSLEDARAADRRVEPVCSFYRWYLASHPEYADLVASA